MKKISVVIVTWNSESVIGACVDSLAAHVPAEGIELILVDNGSADTVYLDSLGERPGVHVVRNGKNLGFSRAVNIGLARASGDYFAVLNPDMIFVSNPFPRLVTELEANPEIGVIGPLLHGEDGRPQIEDFYPKLPTPLQYLLLRSLIANVPGAKRLAVRFFHARPQGDPGVHFVEQIPGAFLFFRRGLFGAEPPLNEAYFIWMEDVDFCRRVKNMGLKVAVVTDEKIVHIGGTSFKMRDHAWKRLVFIRSYLTYLKLYSSPAGYLVHTGLMALNSLCIALLYPLTHGRRGREVVFARMKLELQVVQLIFGEMVACILSLMTKKP